MAGNERFDDSVSRWLEEAAPDRLPQRVLAATFEQTRRTRQDGAWRAVAGSLRRYRFGAALGGAAVIMLVAVLAFNVVPLSGPAGRPTPFPSATARPVSGTLTGGRYAFRPLPDVPSLTLVATGPDGWQAAPSWAMGRSESVGSDASDGIGIAFLSADGIYDDPCHWDLLGNGQEGQPGDVAVGPTVDDLVAALRANTFYASSTATPVTINGYAGQELELQLPAGPFTTCDKAPEDQDGHAFVFSGRAALYVQGPANRWHLFILDVEGTRLIAAILSYQGTRQADLDVARNVIETLDINP